MKRFRLVSLVAILALILAACAAEATPTEELPVTGATVQPTEVEEMATATMAPTATMMPEPTATMEPTAEMGQTIVDIAAGDEQFSTLVAAIEAAGLVETLQGEGPFTVFAPTNEAFEALPEGTLDTLLMPENQQQLIDILTYHVVPGRVMAADVVNLSEAETVLGQPLQISTEGGNVMVNDAQVIATDIEASNGVIHVIDSVLLPEASAEATPAATEEGAMAEMDIVETAVADGRFTTLVAALDAANLVETLKGEGPFTVFAPTDEAFAALPEGTIDTLLMPENRDQLTAILTYHVVPGKVMAADVVELSEAETVQGQPVQIRTENGSVFINDAEVIITDIETSNGVIHVIDSVLLPPDS